MNKKRSCLYLSLIGFNALVLVILLITSWKRWSEPKIDTYQTFMVADLIHSTGGVLYRDFQYFFGPMAPYVNALALAVLGNSYDTFWIIGLINSLIIAFLLYRMILGQAGVLAANMGVFLFFTLCLCANPWGYTAHNYLTPYSYSSTFSVIGLLLTQSAFLQSEKNQKVYLKWITGGAFLFLNRPELGIMLSPLFIQKKHWREFFLWSLPSLAILSVFGFVTGHERFLVNNIFWPPHLPLNHYSSYTSSVLGKGFFSIKSFFMSYFLNVLPFLSLIVIPDKKLSLGIFALLSGLAIFTLDWAEMTLAWPFILMTFCGLLLVKKNKNFRPYLLFTLLAVIISLRVLFNFNIGGYFFYLGVPTIAVLMMIVFKIIPAQKKFSDHERKAYNLIALIFCLGLGAKSFSKGHPNFKGKNLSFQTVRGEIKFDPHDKNLLDTIHWIETETPPDSSVHIIPEGAGITYLSGRRWVIPHAHSLATDFNFYGENFLIDQLKEHRPDYIVITSDFRPFYGTGNTAFPKDYGKDLVDWVTKNYKLVKSFGDNFSSLTYRNDSVLIYQNPH